MTACEKCRMDHDGKEPPCETCRVDLMEENEDAARIYMMVRRQCQTRWNGEQDMEIDLDFNAVFGLMDRYPGGIKDQWGILERVRRCFHHFARLKDAK